MYIKTMRLPWIITCLGLWWIFIGLAVAETGKPLTIGVGRDFYDGPDSRTFLHGSTNTWEALTYLDRNLKAVPWLAQSWKVDANGLTWTFTLRSGVLFHDGSPLSAQDVVASIQRIRAHAKYDPTGNYQEVLSVSAEDKQKVVFRLRTPVPTFAQRIAYYSSPIIKPDGFDVKGHIKSFVATGPFQVAKIIPGSEIRLTATDNYWGPSPAFKTIIFRKLPDAQTRLLALMAGDIDAVADVGGILPQQMNQIRSATHLTLKQVEVATTHMLLFNCSRIPFSDKNMRVWLAGAIDRENLVKTFANGAGQVAFDPFTRLCKEFISNQIHPQSKPFPLNGPQVKDELVLLLHGGTLERWPYADIAQVLQQILNSKGLATRIVIQEAGSFHETVKARQYDIAIQPYTLMTGDPDFFYSYFIAADAPRNVGYTNKSADSLIIDARRRMDQKKRKKNYLQLAQIVSQDLPVLPLYHDISLYAHRSSMSDFEMDQLFRPVLTQGTLWQ